MTRETVRILIADHRGTGLDGRRAFLEAHAYELGRWGSLRETLRTLEAFRPSAILLEPLTRTGTEELEALDLARGEVPVLVHCDREDREAAARAGRALGAGAWDLLFRDAADEELELRL